jgi:hypothetical protein
MTTNTISATRRFRSALWLVTALAGAGIAAGTASQNNFGRAFPTADSAVQALADAARIADRDQLKSILGPASDDLQVSDQVQAQDELEQFAAAYQQGHRIVPAANHTATLEVGTNHWPLPIPLVQTNGQWYFDTDAGSEEVINRRIGRNELSALQTVRVYVDAQREYASRDHDGDGVLEYAQKAMSLPGKKDGLYWPPNLDGEMSPLGPLIAGAQEQGYEAKSPDDPEPRPFRGYYFRILTRQTAHAPGGKYDYIINGNMIGGFALVAWPADYGDSGIMTFIVNQQGRVYQKDLGPETDSIARKITEYDPDPTWRVSPD